MNFFTTGVFRALQTSKIELSTKIVSNVNLILIAILVFYAGTDRVFLIKGGWGGGGGGGGSWEGCGGWGWGVGVDLIQKFSCQILGKVFKREKFFVVRKISLFLEVVHSTTHNHSNCIQKFQWE